MARTDKKVGYSPTGKLEDVTPDMAASGVETAFRMLEGRWKMVIIFHLFDRSVLRFENYLPCRGRAPAQLIGDRWRRGP
jgi:DNA-binding HxlR family transcriptional regulator